MKYRKIYLIFSLTLFLVFIFINKEEARYAFRRTKIPQVPMELTQENIDKVIADFGLELKIGQIREKLYPDNPEIINNHILSVGVVLSIAKELPDYRDLDIKEWVKDNLGVDLNQKHLKAIDKVTDRLLEENERLFEEVKKVVANPEQIESLPEGTISDLAVAYQELGERKLTKDIVPGQPFEFGDRDEFYDDHGSSSYWKSSIEFTFDGQRTILHYSSDMYQGGRLFSSLDGPARSATEIIKKADVTLSGSHLLDCHEYLNRYGHHYIVFVVSDEFYNEIVKTLSPDENGFIDCSVSITIDFIRMRDLTKMQEIELKRIRAR